MSADEGLITLIGSGVVAHSLSGGGTVTVPVRCLSRITLSCAAPVFLDTSCLYDIQTTRTPDRRTPRLTKAAGNGRSARGAGALAFAHQPIRHAPPQCARDAPRGSKHALAPPRRGERAVQGAWPQRHIHHGDRRRGRCLSEPDHLLFLHQGSVVRRGGVSRDPLRGRACRKGGGPRAHAEGLREGGGRLRGGCRWARSVRRGAHASHANGPIWCPRSPARSSGCMARRPAPMRASWRVTGGARIKRPMSPRENSGRSRSASRSKVMPPAAALRRCAVPCRKGWVSWPRCARRSLRGRRRSASSPRPADHPQSRHEDPVSADVPI